MQDTYIEDETFNKEDRLSKAEYEYCVFTNMDFSHQDLSGFSFIDCIFDSCNFSLTKINKTIFRDAQFKNCKMLGLLFDTCNPFSLSFSFEECQLNHSSFYKTKINKTVFRNSQLQETDFSEANLTGAVFDNCDLALATFNQTILEKVDFRTAYNYSIAPETNRIKKAKFSITGLPGLLETYDIKIEE